MLELLFNLGSIILLIASIPNIYSAIKDRNVLKGYSKIGGTLTMIGIFPFLLYAFLNEYWIGFFADVASFAYWIIVTRYVWKK